jgi:hypothetical protein
VAPLSISALEGLELTVGPARPAAAEAPKPSADGGLDLTILKIGD